MDAGLLAQYVAVLVAVLASAAFVVRRQWPAGVRRMRIACAVPLVRATRPQWMQKAGKWIAPAVTRSGAGCADGCDGCGK